MQNIIIYDEHNRPDKTEKEKIISFLFQHLEKFGDPKEDIEKAIDYSLRIIVSFGGFILKLEQDQEILGVVVVNRTGMKDYIPENILVYIATHSDHRGKGLGKKLMKKAIEHAEGSIALHVEPDNPARFLYEKVGFNSKYLEMRYIKQ